MLLANNNLISMCPVTNVCGVFSHRVLPSTSGGQLKTMVTIYWFRVTSSLNGQHLMELFQGYISYVKGHFSLLIIKTVITIITIVVTIFFSTIIIHKIENQLSTEQMNQHIQRNSVSGVGKIKVTSLSLYVSRKRTCPKNKNKYRKPPNVIQQLLQSFSESLYLYLAPKFLKIMQFHI